MADTQFPEGNGIVYCQHSFSTTYGKTAHGLVRRTKRYRVLSVVDEMNEGKDAGMVLDGKPNNILIYGSVEKAVEAGGKNGNPPTHFVIGLAPDGGRLTPEDRLHVLRAIRLGLNVDSGLHDYLSEDEELASEAVKYGVRIRDIRKPPAKKDLHFFSGKIEEVTSFKVAVLGTDSAIGKRTTAWVLVDALNNAGYSAELIGTGQTAWMQGARYSIIMDSLVNDFVSGEIEHAVWSAWKYGKPDVLVIEGQGSLMNPAYPGGFEILAAGRPDVVILQHAPARKEYDGFPGYPIQPLDQQIKLIELLSGKKVAAITINHEGLSEYEIPEACRVVEESTWLPVCDVLLEGAGPLVKALEPYMKRKKDVT